MVVSFIESNCATYAEYKAKYLGQGTVATPAPTDGDDLTLGSMASIAEALHSFDGGESLAKWTDGLGGASKYVRNIANHMMQTQSGGGAATTDRVKQSASGTAKFTLHRRVTAHALGFGTDYLACKFLPLFWESEWPKEVERAYMASLKLRFALTERMDEEEQSPWSRVFKDKIKKDKVQDGAFGVGYLHIRTCYIDKVIEDYAHLDQIVVLGAGFDTRLYRHKKLPKACFEVDAPTTQAEKRRGLAQAGIPCSHVTYVPVDFNVDDWMVKLCEAGFDKSKPTLFLWEGVTYYLTEEIIDFTMASIASCKNVVFVYDIFYGWFSLHSTVNELMARGFGEPFLSGPEPGNEGRNGVKAGLEVIEVVGPDEANERYTPKNREGKMICPTFGAFAMILCKTPGFNP